MHKVQQTRSLPLHHVKHVLTLVFMFDMFENAFVYHSLSISNCFQNISKCKTKQDIAPTELCRTSNVCFNLCKPRRIFCPSNHLGSSIPMYAFTTQAFFIGIQTVEALRGNHNRTTHAICIVKYTNKDTYVIHSIVNMTIFEQVQEDLGLNIQGSRFHFMLKEQ